MEIENIEIRDPYGFIYITTNLVNGKRYLGQKMFKDGGWKRYLGSGKAFKAALNLYKKENFRRDIVHICYSKEELNNAEYDLSVFLNVVEDPSWYNMVYGGGATPGWHHSEEAKRKVGEANKNQSEETRRKRSESAKARCTDEWKRKMSEKNKGRWAGENNPNYGNHSWSGENNPNYKNGNNIGKNNANKPRPNLVGENNPMYGVRRFGANNPNYGNHKLAGKNNPRARSAKLRVIERIK